MNIRNVIDRSAGGVGAPWMSRTGDRPIPVEIVDAVERWARDHGTHGTIRWNGGHNMAEIQLDLPKAHPLMRKYQEGRLRMEPKESILLMYQPTYRDAWGREQKAPHFLPIMPEDLGVDGILEILNRGNLNSGTGEFSGLMEAVQAVADHNDRLKASVLAAARDNARARAREIRRDSREKEAVAIDLKGKV